MQIISYCPTKLCVIDWKIEIREIKLKRAEKREWSENAARVQRLKRYATKPQKNT